MPQSEKLFFQCAEDTLIYIGVNFHSKLCKRSKTIAISFKICENDQKFDVTQFLTAISTTRLLVLKFLKFDLWTRKDHQVVIFGCWIRIWSRFLDIFKNLPNFGPFLGKFTESCGDFLYRWGWIFGVGVHTPVQTMT